MMFIFVMLGLLLCKELAGSSAVTTVFVQKGKNLHLDVNKPVAIPEGDEFRWRFNNTHSIVRLILDTRARIVDPYKGRVEFSVQNHSLLLKNVQHSDSGDYTALITGDKNQRVAEYEVIIQDPVSPVQLSVNSVSNSRESCNLTVTCSTEDSLINSTFRCDNQTCHQEGGEQSEVTSSGSSLRVYLVNDFIICNHINQVSCTRDIKEIQHFCSPTAGSSAVTTVFVQKGNDLHLDVNKPVVLLEDNEFRWRFDDTVSIVRFIPDKGTRISDPYKGRVEFSVQNHSLLLKNVQHRDSGDYTALITGDKSQHLTEYKVIIQDPVSPVQLSVNSVSNSRESCNLTVTCSTEDSLISSTFTCDTQTCNQEGGEQSEVTTSGSSLRVYLLNDFIICNHINQVTCTRDMKEIQHFCSLTAGETEITGSQSISLCLVKTVVFSVGLIIMVSAVISVHLMERLKKQE
ncbi:uncharacterized protein LOC128369698 [Scomber japonicus]|uniref:uncharacterized protein LOC128369698 n=1 Tax=Scomber japonicus TaxID=13676 RepID=UPI0023065651|nr:uncharacterized protein LOC128369698 [Scomber japonicus]